MKRVLLLVALAIVAAPLAAAQEMPHPAAEGTNPAAAPAPGEVGF